MDRRQRKTRQAIYRAFESLMLEQRFDKVTVGHIIEAADISRSTFYAHFESKDALLANLLDETFAPVFDQVEDDPHTHESEPEPTLEPTLAHLLCHLRDSHQGICAKLLAEAEPQTTAAFRARLATFLEPRLPERSSWVPRDLLLSLVVSAFCQAIGWWHEEGYQSAPEQLAHWYLRTFGWPVQKRP